MEQDLKAAQTSSSFKWGPIAEYFLILIARLPRLPEQPRQVETIGGYIQAIYDRLRTNTMLAAKAKLVSAKVEGSGTTVDVSVRSSKYT